MGNNANKVIHRIEKKYLLDDKQYRAFSELAAEHLKQDEYGLHTICSLYHDTDQFDLIRKSIEKPKYKEKLRVRSYGIPGPEDLVYIEIKKKVKGLGNKRRISMPLMEAEKFLQNVDGTNKPDQITKEICYFVKYHHTKPQVLIAYDRRAYFDKDDKNIRVTVDENIRSRNYDLYLGAGDHGTLLLPEGQHLMEVKVPSAMPSWMISAMSELKIYPASFSKYGNVYKSMVQGGKINDIFEYTGQRRSIDVSQRGDLHRGFVAFGADDSSHIYV